MLANLAHDWQDFFQIAGASLGIVGTFQLANRHLRVPLRNIPIHLFAAFTNTRRAAAAIQMSRWAEDNAINSLRGLTLIAIGFFLQMIPNLVHVFESFYAS
jgi:hypothetical protein